MKHRMRRGAMKKLVAHVKQTIFLIHFLAISGGK